MDGNDAFYLRSVQQNQLDIIDWNGLGTRHRS